MDRLQRVCVGARCSERGVEEAVAAALADCRRDRSTKDGIDGQVQRVHALTAVGVGVGIRVGARSGVGLSVPYKALTGGLGLDIVRAVVDSQVQRYHGVDAIGKCECLHIFAGGYVGGAVPCVAVTCCGFNNLGYSAGGLETADIHRAVQSRVAVEVKVADRRCGIARINAGGGGLQLEVAVRWVNEAHIV